MDALSLSPSVDGTAASSSVPIARVARGLAFLVKYWTAVQSLTDYRVPIHRGGVDGCMLVADGLSYTPLWRGRWLHVYAYSSSKNGNIRRTTGLVVR